MGYSLFEVGDKIRFAGKYEIPCDDLPVDGVFVIGAVVPLPDPDGYYVEEYYWSHPDWEWARGKTRLDVAEHPQVVFLKGVPKLNTGFPVNPPDPENKGRRAFSGVYFELAA